MRTWSRTSSRTSVRTFDRTESGGLPPVVADPYFEYTTLLLPGNGTNGAQNNTFLDSSTNNFTITRSGNATQGTFSPFSQTGWGNYFDGSGDYLSVASNAAFALPGAFTFECWFYPRSFDQTASWGDTIFTTTTSGGIVIARPTTGTGNSWGVGNVGVAWIILSTTLPTNNAWNHIVVVRDGSNNISLFLNGTRLGTTTSSASFAQAAVTIGSDNNAADSFLDGYLSNVRLVKGTAVYDPTQSTLTVPTTPLTAITNTSLLTCQSNRFIDNSTNAFAITRNGDVSVQAFSPFNPTAVWSAATNGGSGYFDGSGDYLTQSTNVTLGTSNFTIEFWVYQTARGSSPNWFDGVFVQRNGSTRYQFLDIGGGEHAWYVGDGVTRFVNINLGTLPPLNAWNHYALVRSGNDFAAFINGTRVGTATTTFSVPAGSFDIGWIGTADGYLNGYVNGFRILNGTAAYSPASTSITVPTAPFTAVTNTWLLLNFTNAGIYDATSKNDLETVGNAQISTTQSKFGGSSMYFDGTGDGQFTPNSPNLTLGTGDFTIEFWAYRVGNSVTQGLFDQRTAVANEVRPTIYITSGNNIAFYVSAADRITAALTQNAWVHVAVVRYSGSTKMYLNGVAQATTYSDTNNYLAPTSGTRIGYLVDGLSLNGYIQDFRLTKGYARYTANFTPPTAAFPLL